MRAAAAFVTMLLPHVIQAQATMIAVVVTDGVTIDAETHDLSRVGSGAFGPRGMIAIAQPQDRQVVLFDSTGRAIARIGQRGGGPGEFEGVSKIGFIGDQLWVFDSRLRRLSMFSLEGKFVRSTPVPATFDDGPGSVGGQRWVQPSFLAPAADAGMLMVAFDRQSGGAGLPAQAVLRTSPEGVVRGELFRLPQDKCTQRFGSREVRSPFCNRTPHDAAAGGNRLVAAVWQGVRGGRGRYQLLQQRVTTGGGGGGLVSQYVEVSVPPLTKAEIDSVEKGMSPGSMDAVRRMNIPMERAVLGSITAATDGTVLLTTGLKTAAGRELHLFLPGRSQIGRILLPPAAMVLDVSRDRLLYVVVTEDGIEVVRSARIG